MDDRPSDAIVIRHGELTRTPVLRLTLASWGTYVGRGARDSRTDGGTGRVTGYRRHGRVGWGHDEALALAKRRMRLTLQGYVPSAINGEAIL